MLGELQGLHARIIDCLEQLERLTREVAPPMDRLPDVRLALTRASRARTLLLDRIHSQLGRESCAGASVELAELRSESRRDLISSSSHIGVWSSREIIRRWPDYCAASKTMRDAMRVRIGRERKVIYPILLQIAGGQCAKVLKTDADAAAASRSV